MRHLGDAIQSGTARRVAPFAALMLAACWGAPDDDAHLPKGPAPTWSADIVPNSPMAGVLRLDRLPATYTLPDDNLPPDADSSVSVTLDTFSRKLQHNRTWFRAPAPFKVPRSHTRFKPPGMTVTVNGEPAIFTALMVDPKEPYVWHLDGPYLAVAAPDGVEVTSVEIRHPGALAKLRRLSHAAALDDGFDTDGFVHHAITLGPMTRAGLLLPAPATATWTDVTLPEGARLDAFLAMAPMPIASLSDGASAVIELTTADGAVELARRGLKGEGGTWVPWRADLSAYAGQTGTLTLRIEPGEHAVHDHVVVASPTIVGTAPRPPRRFVVIGIDTIRPDHMGIYGYARATTPNIDAFAKDAVVFDRAWTPAPRTRPSFRTSTTGRLPLQAVCAETIGSVFARHGYATGGVVANVHLNPRFGFDDGFDAWRLDPSGKAPGQVDQAIAWLRQHHDQDSYLFVHFMDPHLFYVPPPAYSAPFEAELDPLPPGRQLQRRYNREMVFRWMMAGQLTDLQKQHIVARHDGEIAFTDHHIGRLIEAIDDLPGDTTVVIHNDHGEEFWDHGGFEHNHTLYDDVVDGVLIVRPPGGLGPEAARSRVPSSMQDIAPTLFELAGFRSTPPTDGVSLVPALRGEAMDPDRAIPVAHLKYDREQWGVIWRDHKYILTTANGREELYDLRADPGEQRNLSGTVDTAPWLAQLGPANLVDAGPGWRIDLTIPHGERVRLTLPTPARAADVLDPQSVTQRPVNQVWGERPPIVADDIASVLLTDGGTTLDIVGGPAERGIVYVRFDAPTPVDGTTFTLDETTEAVPDNGIAMRGVRLQIQPGPVVVPPPDESTEMALCRQGEDEDGPEDHLDADRRRRERQELKELGYIDAHDGDDDLKDTDAE